jgi:hypothetical protein
MQRMGVLRYFGIRTIDEHTAWKQTMAPTELLEVEITKLAQSSRDVVSLQRHLKEIIEGPAFKSSHRCGQFLKHIVDQAIAGHFELLKERTIGIELFGRPPAYDTGEDAIVRVTASEVRKRLLQHYGSTIARSDYRISLPLGSYVPSITRSNQIAVASSEPADIQAPQDASREEEADSETAQNIPDLSDRIIEPKTIRRNSRWVIVAAALLALNVGVWFLFGYSSSWRRTSPLSVLPWSTLFSSPNSTVVITSDPNIAEIQGYTGGQLTVSDYANHNYFVGPNKLTPEEDRFCRIVLRGDKAASVDTPIAVAAGELASSVSKKMTVRGARDVQLADLKTDSNFIILGSPRSNPWAGLFSDQLDFRFAIDNDSRREMIVNAHPRAHEQKSYIPTAPGWATGQSYAMIAFLQNPDSHGHILLLGGADGEGTEAAGRLVTDLPRLSQALEQCGLDHSRKATNFEMLLRLNTMAGSPSHVDVIACHDIQPNLP